MTPFRSAMFRRLWLSSIASAWAQGMERTVTAWLALELGAGAVTIGLIFAARMLPSLLLGLVAGTFADRHDRRAQLAAVGGGALALLAAFGALVASGAAAVWHLVLFSLLAGCVQVFDTPARQALVVDTAPEGTAVRALALNALAGRFAGALGALAAGALIPLAGLPTSYFVAAATFGVVALLGGSVRAPHDHRARLGQMSFGQALRGAARLVVELPTVRTLVVAGLVCEVFAFSHMTAVPLFAQDVLRAGPAGLGTLNAAQPIGGALAVTLLALLPERLRRQPILGAIFLAYGLTIMGLAATRDLALAVVVMVLMGFCAGAFDVLQQTLMQLAAPPDQRGRAMGLWVFSIGSAPIGHLEMGAMIAALGVPAALAINGALTLATALVMVARHPQYRPVLWGRWLAGERDTRA